MVFQPRGITIDKKSSVLKIDWTDDLTSEITFTVLRYACPCAECRGGHDNMGTAPDPSIYELPAEDTPATRIQKVNPVGTYGITIAWEDGHHYGIYNWQYLREL